MEKMSRHKHLCRTKYGLPTYPAVGVADVVLEPYCRWILEGKRAKARIDYLAPAQDQVACAWGGGFACYRGNVITSYPCWKQSVGVDYFMGGCSQKMSTNMGPLAVQQITS